MILVLLTQLQKYQAALLKFFLTRKLPMYIFNQKLEKKNLY